MHRLLQELMQNAASGQAEVFEAALLAHVKSRADFLWDRWVQHEHRWELAPLAACAWQWIERGSQDGTYFANQAFGPLHQLGNFADAEALMRRRALTFDEQSLGPDHRKVATDLNNLASVLKATNRLAEAEPLMRRALEVDEQSFGSDHPNVAIRLNNLALLL